MDGERVRQDLTTSPCCPIPKRSGRGNALRTDKAHRKSMQKSAARMAAPDDALRVTFPYCLGAEVLS